MRSIVTIEGPIYCLILIMKSSVNLSENLVAKTLTSNCGGRNRPSPNVGALHSSWLYSLTNSSRILSIFILSRSLVKILLTFWSFQNPAPSLAPFDRSSWLKNRIMVPTSFNWSALYCSLSHVFEVWSTKNLMSKGQMSALMEQVLPSEPRTWPHGHTHLWLPSPRSRHSWEQPPLLFAHGDATYSIFGWSSFTNEKPVLNRLEFGTQADVRNYVYGSLNPRFVSNPQ